jgi:YggT family protein
MFGLDLLFSFIEKAVVIFLIAVVVLMLVRLIFNYVDINPFSWPSLTLRRITDPMINPVRRVLAGFGIQPKVAPLITILIVILLGWLTLQLVASILNIVAGILISLSAGEMVALVGYILYGLLSLYSMFLLIRIIFSWGMVSYSNPLMRFLANLTDPLLLPLRRVIPPIGMFDISPIVAFFIIFLFQSAIAGTLLRGHQLQFFA